MIFFVIGLFIGAFIGFIFAALIACGRGAGESTSSPSPFHHYPDQDQPTLPYAPSTDFPLFRRMS